MRKYLIAAALPALLLLAALPAAARTEIARIGWEVSKLENKQRLPFVALTELRADPAAKFTDRLRAVITLRNASGKKAEGLVVRYALRLRMLKDGEPAEKAFWGVPYYVEEVRVAVVAPQSERAARAVNFWLAEQFAKLRGTGFTPTALKMEVALSPRTGDDPAALSREALLEIIKP